MNRSHIQAHAQVVEALSGHAPRKSPHLVAQYNDGSGGSQINPPSRTSKSNFRNRSNRRKTTGFEEIRQEYYQIHQNRATAQPAEEGSAVHHRPATADDPEDFFPKPSAFIKAPRRTLPARRPIHTVVDDTELFDGGGFRTRGSKAADMFQRRRERTDQYILEQEEKATHGHMSNPTNISLTQQGQSAQLTPNSWEPAHREPVARPNAPPTHHKPQMESQQSLQPQRAKSQMSHPPRREEPAYHTQQQQSSPQQQYNQQQHQSPQSYHSNQTQQSQKRNIHTTVDSRRTRKPLAPVNPRFDRNSSPWNDRNMEPGKRFHPNVIPYQDSYNTSPKGWGGTSADNNVKYQYTSTTEKFKFNPAPRINKFGSGLGAPFTTNYNSRPRSWCDIENYSSQAPPPSRRAYPATQRQSSESSVNQFTGPSRYGGHGESDEL